MCGTGVRVTYIDPFLGKLGAPTELQSIVRWVVYLKQQQNILLKDYDSGFRPTNIVRIFGSSDNTVTNA